MVWRCGRVTSIPVSCWQSSTHAWHLARCRQCYTLCLISRCSLKLFLFLLQAKLNSCLFCRCRRSSTQACSRRVKLNASLNVCFRQSFAPCLSHVGTFQAASVVLSGYHLSQLCEGFIVQFSVDGNGGHDLNLEAS